MRESEEELGSFLLHLLDVAVTNFTRQRIDNPLIEKGFCGGGSLAGFPLQTTQDQLKEVVVAALQLVLEFLAGRAIYPAG